MKDLKELYDTVNEIYKRHHTNSDFACYIQPQIRIQSMFGKSCKIYPYKAGVRTMIELVYYFTGGETNNDEQD